MFTLKLRQPTYLKTKPFDSTTLKAEEKSVVRGMIQVDWFKSWGNHLVVSQDNKLSYLFTAHVDLSKEQQLLPYFQPGAPASSIIRACDAMGLPSNTQKAYVLATINHETAGTMKPIEEYMGRQQAVKLGYDGGENYFGRGFVQITHRYNYLKYSRILGIDLVKNPSLALDASISLFIAVHGMKNGVFTGKKLEDYLTNTKTDFVNARRVINGSDKAQKIADLATNYLVRLFTPKKQNTPQESQNNSQSDYIGLNPDKVAIISQRDNNADRNKDGVNDKYQTCNIHACSMVIQALTTNKPTIVELDNKVIRLPGSRYSHNNLVSLLDDYGVNSKFSTSTTTKNLLEHLKTGNPAIWSNKLTNSGHIVVVAGYSKSRDAFLIFDSYGEPSRIGGKWVYQDIRKSYWLSTKSFNSVSMNGSSTSHWLHLCKPE